LTYRYGWLYLTIPCANYFLLEECSIFDNFNPILSPMIIPNFVKYCLVGFLLSPILLAEPGKPFVHPGMMHSKAEIAFVKEKISLGEQPWKSAWEQLQSDEVASLSYTPTPEANVVRGARNRPDIGSSDFSNDAAAAYAHALQWSLTGKREHATKVIEILNAWSGTLKSVGGHDAKLLVGFCDGYLS